VSKPPILLIHGAFCHAAFLAPWHRYFTEAGYHCTTPSLPGHDPSDPALLSSLGFPDFLSALRDVHRGMPEPPIVIGHSMGGLLAQHLAAERGCAALVCVASAPPWRLSIAAASMPWFLPSLPRILAGLSFRPSPRAADFLVSQGLPHGEREEIRRGYGHESGRACRSMILGRVSLKGAAPPCPVLCISGKEDRIVSTRTGAKLARRYRAEHVVVPFHGHWLIARSLVDIVAARIRTWLDQRFGDDSASRGQSAESDLFPS
jgi:pimeloyl-ACP methyl ester carboxylesterase